MYAIIEDSGSQIKVSEGDVIKVDPRELPENAVSIDFDKVLVVAPGVGGKGKAKIGEPHVKGAKVSAEILHEGREPKIEVVKFKRRKGYTRRKGHRQSYLKVQVTKIATG